MNSQERSANSKRKLREINLFTAGLGLWVILLAIILLETLGIAIPLVRPLLTTIVLSIVPGALVLSIIGVHPEPDVRWFVYALGSSLILVMIVGVLHNLLLPLFGVDKPFLAPYLAVTYSVLLGTLAAVTYRRDSWNRAVLSMPGSELLSPTPLLLMLVLPVSILAVLLINRTGQATPMILLLVFIALIPLLVAVSVISPKWHALGVWMMSLAILSHKNLWSLSGNGGSPVLITVANTARWTPGLETTTPSSTALLEFGTLLPTYSYLAGEEITMIYLLVSPVIVSSIIPLAIFATVRQYTSSKNAFLAANLFMFAHPYYLQFLRGGRAASPVLFLALFALALSDGKLQAVSRTMLSLAFVAGISMTHYGTSYFVLFAIVGAFGLLIGFRLVDDQIVPRLGFSSLEPDGGTEWFNLGRHRPSTPSLDLKTLTLGFTLFYVVFTIAWYLFLNQGNSFATLPRHVVSATESLIQGDYGGTTASRLQRNYGAVSITYSKFTYLTFAGLMGIGLLGQYVRRFGPGETRFDDEYLALATTLLAGFGSTILINELWGGGRPMMITWSFTTVFAVLGAIDVWNLGLEGVGTSWRYLSRNRPRHPPSFASHARLLGRSFIAILLAVMLVLNTGVAAAIALEGEAPSNVPLHRELAVSENPRFHSKVYRETDIQTHLWLLNNRDESFEVFGDWIAKGQTDWYSIDIAARFGSLPYTDTAKPRGHLAENLQKRPDSSAYVLLLGHNVNKQIIVPRRGDQYWDTVLEPKLERRQKIYTSGESAIFFNYNASETMD